MPHTSRPSHLLIAASFMVTRSTRSGALIMASSLPGKSTGSGWKIPRRPCPSCCRCRGNGSWRKSAAPWRSSRSITAARARSTCACRSRAAVGRSAWIRRWRITRTTCCWSRPTRTFRSRRSRPACGFHWRASCAATTGAPSIRPGRPATTSTTCSACGRRKAAEPTRW